MPQQLGLSNEDTVLGLQLVQSWRKDPIGTLKYILTEAKAMGHNIEGINCSQIDTDAVGRIIYQKLSPFIQDRQQQLDVNTANTKATEAYNGFIAQYPDAVNHQDVIADMLRRDNSLTPVAAYYKLQTWTIQHGLDFSQPLQAQMQQQQTQQQGVPPQTQQATRPMVGGQTLTQQTTQQPNADNGVAPADAEFDDIIAQVLVENGLKP